MVRTNDSKKKNELYILAYGPPETNDNFIQTCSIAKELRVKLLESANFISPNKNNSVKKK